MQVSKSPILQAWINQMNKGKAPQPPAASIINIIQQPLWTVPACWWSSPSCCTPSNRFNTCNAQTGFQTQYWNFLYNFLPLGLDPATIERKCLHQNTCIHTYGDGRIVGNGFQGRRDCWPERGSERMGSPQAIFTSILPVITQIHYAVKT